MSASSNEPMQHCSAAKPVCDEKRIALDGPAYTEREFQEWYGNLRPIIWHQSVAWSSAAKPACDATEAPSRVRAARAAQIPAGPSINKIVQVVIAVMSALPQSVNSQMIEVADPGITWLGLLSKLFWTVALISLSIHCLKVSGRDDCVRQYVCLRLLRILDWYEEVRFRGTLRPPPLPQPRPPAKKPPPPFPGSAKHRLMAYHGGLLRPKASAYFPGQFPVVFLNVGEPPPLAARACTGSTN
jgi:hypothetical protein